ncbi:MAG: DegT/DnrJ/EryC1/StrS family aminotransferase [bacterium]|nr:DegT/DnrJ/EryC1/StrS family aminotransferase [bacterium]
MSTDLAILGGPKVFPQGLPFTQPTLPAWEEICPELEGMYRSGWLTKGPCLRRFEDSVAEYLGVSQAVAVSSCTSGLILALQSLQLPPGGEVIVPSFSFMATFHALYWNNLAPVFVDVEPDTFTVDAEQVRRAINPKTVGIMAASTFGNPPAWERLLEVGKSAGVPVFSDSAHGMGTLYHDHKLGGHGVFEVFSLSPTKLLVAGEGGIVATSDSRIADWVKAGRDYGNPGDYDCPHVGLNGRMSEFHAVLGWAALKHLDEYAEHRNSIAQAYKERLSAYPGLSFQKIREEARPSYKDFAVLVNEEEFGINRDVLAKALSAEGVPTRAYFSPAGHKLTPYKQCRCLDLTHTERISSQVICLPISSHMSLQTVDKVCKAVGKIYAQRDKLTAID